jgi:hypothetical protein
VPNKFRELHLITKKYFNDIHPKLDLLNIDTEPSMGCFYMTSESSPLLKYIHYKKDSQIIINSFEKKIPFSSLYNEYGNYLILNHLQEFTTYVVFPNTVAYFIPYAEMYGPTNQINNLMNNDLGNIAKKWFNITSTEIQLRYVDLREEILSPFPFVFTIINLAFFITLIYLVIMRIKIMKFVYTPLILLISTCILNFVFSIIATTSVMRFQLFNFLLELTILLVVWSKIITPTRETTIPNHKIR